MKSPSIIVLLLLAISQSVWGNDEAKSSSKSSSHSAAPPGASSNAAPATSKGPQTVTRRPVNPASNPNLRPVNPTANAPNSRRIPPTANRNRTILPSSSPEENQSNKKVAARNAPNRTAAVTPNQRSNTKNNGAHRTRIPTRTGNELSFSQARTQCSRQHHDRNWWRHHHSRICFYGGGYWFWNAGWWFPAWGYSPYYNSYVYDGPIYGYGQLSPGDVTAQVQQTLAELGYYYGAIDGVLGPDTRDAILRFQADNGLATTAAIDEPTLDSLGLT